MLTKNTRDERQNRRLMDTASDKERREMDLKVIQRDG